MSYSPLQLAEAHIRAGELEDALDALNAHLAETSDDDDARRLRADVLARMDAPESVAKALADVDAIQQLTPEDHITRSVLLERLGRPDDALIAVRQAYRKHDDDRLTERYLYMLRRRGEVEAARAIVAELPYAWRWSQWAGDLAVDAGELAEALDHFSAALDALQERYAIDTTQAATIMVDASATEAASLTVTAAYGRLLLTRADVYTALDNRQSARADYDTARALLPDDPVIPFNLGILAARDGDRETALSLCREALEAASPALREHLVAALRREPSFDTLHDDLGIGDV